MTLDSLRHDCAWACTSSIIEVFAPLLREEEKAQASAEVFPRLLAMLECFEIKQNRLDHRLYPSEN